MKIVLLHPYGSNWLSGMKDISTVFNLMPPLGMMSMAAVLERVGIDVEIIDCYATPMPLADLVEEIVRRAPDCLGVSTTTSSFNEGYRVAAAVKEKAPQIFTLFGGAHACTIGAPLLDSFPAIDCLAIGEGENTMLVFTHRQCANSSISIELTIS